MLWSNDSYIPHIERSSWVSKVSLYGCRNNEETVHVTDCSNCGSPTVLLNYLRCYRIQWLGQMAGICIYIKARWCCSQGKRHYNVPWSTWMPVYHRVWFGEVAAIDWVLTRFVRSSKKIKVSIVWKKYRGWCEINSHWLQRRHGGHFKWKDAPFWFSRMDPDWYKGVRDEW